MRVSNSVPCVCETFEVDPKTCVAGGKPSEVGGLVGETGNKLPDSKTWR